MSYRTSFFPAIVIALLFAAPAQSTDITYADKTTGSTFTAADAQEIKTAVNSKADSTELTAAQAEIDTNTAKISFDSTSSTRLANTSGSNTGDQLAAGVTIADAGTIIVATEVEAALQENRTAINLNTAKITGAVVATGFNGNLATTDDTPQEIAQALDDLSVSGSMQYPGAGIPSSSGTAWDTSYTVTTLKDAMQAEDWVFSGAVDISSASSVSLVVIAFEGATADEYETSFSMADPTADRTISGGDFDMRIPKSTSVNSDGTIPDAIEFVIDGGGSAITTGVKGFLEIPWAGVIDRVTTFCDQSGSVVLDVWLDSYTNYPPTIADTITAAAKPTLSSATKAQDATLTGWTTAITAGDIVGFNVDSATTVERCTISLKVSR